MAYSAQIMVLNQAPDTALIGSVSSQTVVYISLIYGFSLLVNAWAFYRISGGLFNPAVRMTVTKIYHCAERICMLTVHDAGGLRS